VDTDAEKYAAFDAADAALAASGTVTSELALAGTPMVVGYKVGWLTFALVRHMIKVPHIVLINLVLGRRAVPEFLQDACTPGALAQALLPLLTDERARAQQKRDLEEAARAFGLGQESPSLRAARAVLSLAESAHTENA
jgi:lipid-A-disaccharide synthase